MPDRSAVASAGIGLWLLFWTAVIPSAANGEALTLYVAPGGNDAWSGKAPDASETDGPFASIERTRDEIRKLKDTGGVPGPVNVLIRGGEYYLDHTIRFDTRDSGTTEAPITYQAYPGENPELVGGRRLADYRIDDNGLAVYTLPETKDKKWGFRSLFVDGKRQVRARLPNFDPKDPYRGGFNYTGRCEGGPGRTVGNIHTAGDQLEYSMEVPVAGTYSVWMNYASFNSSYDMSGRISLAFDGEAPIQLASVPNTVSWKDFQWKAVATVSLKGGKHRFIFKNEKGGGINLTAFALADDPAWRPDGTKVAPAVEEKHHVMVQAEDFIATTGKNMTLTGGSFNPFEFYYNPGDLGTVSAEMLIRGAEIHIFPSADDACRAFKEIVPIWKVDEGKHKITVGGREAAYGIGIGDRYFIENAFALLDVSGEWYLNETTGMLYYKPVPGFSSRSEVVAPTVERLMEFGGGDFAPVSYVAVRGLTFRATDYSPNDAVAGYNMGSDGVVYLKNARNCAVEECRFTNIGKYAVYINGGEKNRVNRNNISDSAEGGVLLHDASGNDVSDNVIHDCGLVYKHVGAVVLEGKPAGGNTVSHNDIHNISRYGISLKNTGTANVIEFNKVSNTNLETYDTGGIEVTQQDKNFISGGIIRNNIVADTIGYSTLTKSMNIFSSWGIYLDSYASGFTVVDNIVFRNAQGGIMIQGGKENIVRNNIFSDSTYYQMLIANQLNNSKDNVLENNIIYYTNADSYAVHANTLEQKTVSMRKNLYFCTGNPKIKISSPNGSDFAEWQQKGYDVDSIVADPLFVDYGKHDYILKSTSPAFKLGFQKIKTGTVGPRE